MGGPPHDLAQPDQGKLSGGLKHPWGCQQHPPEWTTGELPSLLPQKNKRILLVEDDGSTRHVVTALLRNCGYEVTSAESARQAWGALQDRSRHFDLALIEIMPPTLAGIGLLARMKTQKSCKQISVVMMSSLDSADIVFKCLSEGAADFLVKPVRKNELNNLWQHVWRKSQRVSGNVTHREKVEGLKQTNHATNDSESSGNEGNGLKFGCGSDNGSSTQRFWTDEGAEIDSRRKAVDWDMNSPAHHEDLLLTDDIWRVESRPEDAGSPTPKNLKIVTLKASASEVPAAKTGHLKDPNHIEVEQHEPQIDNELQNSGDHAMARIKAATLYANIDQPQNKENPQSSKGGEVLEREGSKCFDSKGSALGLGLLPELELTLKRSSTSLKDHKMESGGVLQQSGPSAFSRYTSTRGALQHQPLCSVGPIALSTFPLRGSKVSLNAPICSGYSNQATTPSTKTSSGQGGLAHAAKEDTAFAFGAALSTALPSGAMAAFNGDGKHPVFYFHPMFPWGAASHCISQGGHAYRKFESFDLPLPQAYHHYHHHVQHHHHHQDYKDHVSPKSSEEEQTVTNDPEVSGPLLCGSSSTMQPMPDGVTCIKAGSVNGSASGSTNRDDTSNGQSAIMTNARPICDIENSNENNAREVGHGLQVVSGENGGQVAVVAEQYFFTRRDVALNKFRQKRKERCFDKKVRYQSRKRLAEQRPRVRGQFVRQVMHVPADADKGHGKA